jgi:ParB family chromosome partitioning protein
MTRLLRLPHEVRENVAAGTIAMGHARALLSLPDEGSQLRWGREVVARQLSVRETEVLVKKALTPAAPREAPAKDVHTRAAEDRLRFALGTAVRIVRKGKGGRIEVDFTSEDELHRLYEQMVDKK